MEKQMMGRPKLNRIIKTVSISEDTVNKIAYLSEYYGLTLSSTVEMAIKELYEKVGGKDERKV